MEIGFRKEVNLMNNQEVDYKRFLGIEGMLTADTIMVVLGIFVALWLWVVTP